MKLKYILFRGMPFFCPYLRKASARVTRTLCAVVVLSGLCPRFAVAGPSLGTPSEAERPPDRIEVYKKTAQGTLHLYFYLPPGWKVCDHRTAVVIFHGGSFTTGIPDSYFATAEYLAGRGLVCCSVEYRVPAVHGADVKMTDEVADARSAIRWVKAHATELGIDPHSVIGAGESAGAAMVASLAFGTGPDDPQDNLFITPVPVAMLLFCPGASRRLRDSILEGKADPLSNMHAGGPPALMIYGKKDGFISEGIPLAEKLQAEGNDIELWMLPNAAHAPMEQAATRNSMLLIVDQWLQRHHLLAGPATVKENAAFWPPARKVLDNPSPAGN